MNAVDRNDERQNLQSYEEQRHLKQKEVFYLVNIVWEEHEIALDEEKARSMNTRFIKSKGGKKLRGCQTADLLRFKNRTEG